MTEDKRSGSVYDRRSPLELDGAAMRALVDLAMARIIEHIDTLERQPAAVETGGAELARSLVESLPQTGTPPAELMELLFERVIPVSYNTASAGYLAYIPGGGLLHSAVADLIANAVNRYVGVWIAAPGLVQLEANVVRWFCQIVGYPEDAGGVLTTGGSLANLFALITARRVRLPADFLAGTIYTSADTHHSIQRAAVLAGFPPANVRDIPVDDARRIDVRATARQIEQDRHDGLLPFCLVGNAGTTNTGAIDDLDGLASLAAEFALWFHVDAAYGGFFALTERGRARMAGLARADSMSLDPHKGLFLPYGTGSLLVRDPETLWQAHSVFAHYMPAMQEDHEFVDFTQISPELSRDFRGLRAWLPIKMHGIDVFRDQLDEKLDLTEWAHQRLREISDVEIVAPPQLSVVAFRLRRPGWDATRLNALNREFMRRINARGNVYLTGTMLGPDFALRICVLSFRTHRDRMETCLSDIEQAAGTLVGPA
jgi:aromatic-L-amino-acid decarboxylase